MAKWEGMVTALLILLITMVLAGSCSPVSSGDQQATSSSADSDDFEGGIKRANQAGMYSFGLGKRGPPGHYGFGLGKRGPAGHYGFGLGKRGPPGMYGFGLGKRAEDSAFRGETWEDYWKRDPGQRGSSRFGFGLGKRSADDDGDKDYLMDDDDLSDSMMMEKKSFFPSGPIAASRRMTFPGFSGSGEDSYYPHNFYKRLSYNFGLGK